MHGRGLSQRSLHFHEKQAQLLPFSLTLPKPWGRAITGTASRLSLSMKRGGRSMVPARSLRRLSQRLTFNSRGGSHGGVLPTQSLPDAARPGSGAPGSPPPSGTAFEAAVAAAIAANQSEAAAAQAHGYRRAETQP